jgi:hypothetical protein
LYIIEFQKHGLPHAHILLWLDLRDKLESADSVNSVIVAELPDQKIYPKLYASVTSFMIHRPCDFARPNSPCMKDRCCSKFYPKKFVSRTSFDERGYHVYQRRDLGYKVVKKHVELNNCNVVPYNPTLIMRYNAHVNTEYCNRFLSI